MTPGLAVAATAGVLSFLSPCMVPVVPGFLARLGGLDADGPTPRRRLFLHALLFVAGFSLVFAALGVALESVLAGASTQLRAWLARAAGIVVVGFGLHLTGLVEVRGLDRGAALPATEGTAGLAGSLLLGAAFAATWTPCVGPILGSTLALAAASPAAAFPVLLAYALGLGVPFLLVSLAPGRARRLLSGRGRTTRRLRRGFGVVLLALGVLVFTRRLGLLGVAVYAPEVFA
ncbi:MAG: cytochrome c biogenesis protein [uncultured archaeon A07HB70]|nr:MAG: cytochrome c biogenesis protein [uncultured archaeon A07HB70]